jgi:hypothetical protein
MLVMLLLCMLKMLSECADVKVTRLSILLCRFSWIQSYVQNASISLFQVGGGYIAVLASTGLEVCPTRISKLMTDTIFSLSSEVSYTIAITRLS